MDLRSRVVPVSRRNALLLGSALPLSVALPGRAFAERPVAAYDGQPSLQDFGNGWLFEKRDNPAFSQARFDDSSWRALDLPHDWSVEDLDPLAGPSANADIRQVDTAALWDEPGKVPYRIGPFESRPPLLGSSSPSAGEEATGHTVGGVGWYRKRFRLAGLPDGGRAELQFDGVYMNAELWLNDAYLGRHTYGYTPFAVDLTDHLVRDGDNLFAVRVANLGKNSRWYSGSGIDRAVRLRVTGPMRFAPFGLTITTPEVSSAAARVEVRAEIEGPAAGATFRAEIHDARGRLVASAEAPASADAALMLAVPRPALWSPETPVLYSASCTLRTGERVHDTSNVRFGIRRVELDAVQGLRINGKPTKLRGGCIHHDNGLLGSAAFPRADERKIELLKARGFNAIRLSHNPASSELLDACDRLGMLVLAEAFDMWRVAKNPDDYSLYFDEQWHSDLAAMVRRDRNHPSIIIWSIGNEIPEKAEASGIETARQLAAEVRRLDPTRPVTEAINTANGPAVTRPDGTPDQAVTQYLDIAGYNYKLGGAVEAEHQRFPARIFLGTESVASETDHLWRMIEKSPWVIGDFVWTAVDYLGESGIGHSVLGMNSSFNSPYPWFNAFCGDIDLIGEQKPQSLFRDVVWGVSLVELSVQRPIPQGAKEGTSYWGWRDELRSWTWPGAEGKALNVSVFTRGDRAVLLLNGKQIGAKDLDEKAGSIARFDVPYEPGRLVARAYRGSRLLGERSLETAGAPAALRLRLDRPQISAARDDLAYVTIEVVDAQGRLVPDAVHVLEAKLAGAIELAGFGNANPRGLASFRQPVAKTWHGRALLIVRSGGEPGRAMIQVSSKDLKPAAVPLTIAAEAPVRA